ncbi:MAG: NYN domain-containing protein, partial [Planctomycetota bacterium]
RLRRALATGTILLDGHNICWRTPALAAAMQADSEAGRRALENRIRRARHRTIAFYDGGPDGRSGMQYRNGLRCLYSGSRSADDQIIAQLRRFQERAVLVSDDRELIGRGRAHGALACGVLEYLSWLDEGPGKASEDGNRHVDLTDDEVTMWVRLFEGE